MYDAVVPPNREHWLAEIFSAQAVRKGGVVRRSVVWVESQIGREALIDAVRCRGFHLVETGGQFIIICHSGGIRMIC